MEKCQWQVKEVWQSPLQIDSINFKVAVWIKATPPPLFSLSVAFQSFSSTSSYSSSSIMPMVWPAILGPFIEAQPQGFADNKALHDERGAEPRYGVLGRDQPHEVVAELGVVPGTGIELPKQQPRPKLPQVGPQSVDDAAQQHGAAAAQLQVHPLYNEDAGAVDEEGPHAGHTGEFPVAVDHKLPGSSEHHFTEVAMDGVEVPAGESRERNRVPWRF